MMKFDPNVVIETDRLVLRYMRSSDRHALFVNINNDKEVLKYFLDKYLEDESELLLDKRINFCIENKRYLFSIELKENHEVIGMILQCSVPDQYFNNSEIGYAIGRKYWNHGYVTEAMKAMIDFVFSAGVNKVIASHIVGNNASKRVIEKCGMIFEGRRKEDLYYHEQYYDVDYYYLLKDHK